MPVYVKYVKTALPRVLMKLNYKKSAVGHQFSETFMYTPLQPDKLPEQIYEEMQLPATVNDLKMIIELNLNLFDKPDHSACDAL